jgi:hypothetical protein
MARSSGSISIINIKLGDAHRLGVATVLLYSHITFHERFRISSNIIDLFKTYCPMMA